MNLDINEVVDALLNIEDELCISLENLRNSLPILSEDIWEEIVNLADNI